MGNKRFLEDVIKGLQASPKYLQSKYFYDKKGDKLFEHIMRSRDYYLTRSELEIFKKQKKDIADAVLKTHKKVDVIALGPGDFSKTIYLFQELVSRNAIGKFFPIDISENIIARLQSRFDREFPGIPFQGFAGDYFERLPEVTMNSKNKRLVFFVGATIGNFLPDEMLSFCRELHHNLTKGDLVLIGFDLKKDPEKILAAYNDAEGWTTKFNLNLLRRINSELGGNFQIKNFKHYPVYDPQTGACKSFLISKKEQAVSVDHHQFHFHEGETIYMEVSQKYDIAGIQAAARDSGFRQITAFMDSNKNFVDVLWEVR